MNYNCSGEAGRVGSRRKPDLWSPRVVYKPLLSGNATATWSTVPVMHSASLSKVFLTSVAFSNPHSIPWVDKGQDCIYPFYRYGNSLMMIMWLGQGHIARRHENQAWNPVTRASIFFHDLETVVSIPLSNSGHFRVQFWEVRQVLGNTAGLSVSTQSCQRFKGQQVSGGPQQVWVLYSVDVEVGPQIGWATRWASTASPQDSRGAPTPLPFTLCCVLKSLSGLWLPRIKENKTMTALGPG